MKKLFLIISLLSLSLNGISQDFTTKRNELIDDDFEKIKEQIDDKIITFQRYVSNLAGNDFTHKEKMEVYRKALELFIGQGEPYEERNEAYDRVEEHPAVKMGVFPSKNNKTKREYYLMTRYLTKLIRNSETPNFPYKKVVIESSNVIRVDGLRKIGEGRYIAAAHYLQKYTGYKSTDLKKWSYQDFTEKTVTVYIERVEVFNLDGGLDVYWDILLGDVDCDDVW